MRPYYVVGWGTNFCLAVFFHPVNTEDVFLLFLFSSLCVWTRVRSTEGHIWKTSSLRCWLFSPLALWRPGRRDDADGDITLKTNQLNNETFFFCFRRNTQRRLIVSTYRFLAGLVKYVEGQRQKRLEDE